MKASNLKTLRVKAGLTQKELALLSGVSKTTIAALEGSSSEKYFQSISVGKLSKLAKVLEVGVSDLLPDDIK